MTPNQKFWTIFLGLTFSFVLGAYYWFSQPEWTSFAVATIIMSINVVAWKAIVKSFLSPHANTILILTLGSVKLLVLCMVIWASLEYLSLAHLPFGLGIFMVAISAACASVPFAKNKESV